MAIASSLLTRNGAGLDRSPAASYSALGRPDVTTDVGRELVALRTDGVSSFPELSYQGGADHRLHFYVFDWLRLDGWGLRPCVLIDRKRLSSTLTKWRGILCYGQHMEGSEGELYQRHAREEQIRA